MPKNKKGGKGAKKGKNYTTQNTQLILKENEGEEYGIVKSKNGNLIRLSEPIAYSYNKALKIILSSKN